MTRVASPFINDDADALRELCHRRLDKEPVAFSAESVRHGDFDLNPGLDMLFRDGPTPRAAAVLIPIVMRQPLSVILTLRAPTLSSHAGQISFPGGKMDASDASPTETALREAEEEIALQRCFVEPLGFSDAYRTGTGFLIAPLVALVSPQATPKPADGEVAHVFEVPLAFLMNEANMSVHTREWRGAERRFYALDFQQNYIWGATAGIIRALQRRLSTA